MVWLKILSINSYLRPLLYWYHTQGYGLLCLHFWWNPSSLVISSVQTLTLCIFTSMLEILLVSCSTWTFASDNWQCIVIITIRSFLDKLDNKEERFWKTYNVIAMLFEKFRFNNMALLFFNLRHQFIPLIHHNKKLVFKILPRKAHASIRHTWQKYSRVYLYMIINSQLHGYCFLVLLNIIIFFK